MWTSSPTGISWRPLEVKDHMGVAGAEGPLPDGAISMTNESRPGAFAYLLSSRGAQALMDIYREWVVYRAE